MYHIDRLLGKTATINKKICNWITQMKSMRSVGSGVASIVIGLTFSPYVFGGDLDGIAKKAEISKIEQAIASGNREAFSKIPAKGYKQGVSDFLKTNDLYVNPEYSFTECYIDVVMKETGGYAPGCRVSLKLARKSLDGTLRDIGIRAEWAMQVGENRFKPNNSVYARYITEGNTAMLGAALGH